MEAAGVGQGNKLHSLLFLQNNPGIGMLVTFDYNWHRKGQMVGPLQGSITLQDNLDVCQATPKESHFGPVK